MNTQEKRTLTSIKNDPIFKKRIRKLTLGMDLSYEEKVYILSCAILFFKHFEKDRRHTSYVDFAYYIILKYAIHYQDYKPLFDFSINFGFYPIAKDILDSRKISDNLINEVINNFKLERYRVEESYTQTIEQYIKSKKLLEDKSFEKCYIAPTSFGKSSIIIDYISKLNRKCRIAIVVPTKSLLMQTYRMIRGAGLEHKILIHDEMYDDDESFIAVFTQERALRLLNRKNIYYENLIIDEAHNILNNDSRSILLSRLLSKNRQVNPTQEVLYLSPLINDPNQIRLPGSNKISSHIINFNIKEPEIFEYRLNSNVYKYNRFINDFFKLSINNKPFNYIHKNSLNKNFIYNYRPVKIETLAKQLCHHFPEITMIDEIQDVIDTLKREVHHEFNIIRCLYHGIVYIHGKLPDLIKEYLEHKYKTIPELRYIIANSVILEGMNLPIDCLFIMNTRGLRGKELSNLIGRVNRLNEIFNNNTGNLQKLLPQIHFINTEEHNKINSNMTHKIEMLRGRTFVDKVENPTLDSFDIDKLGLGEEAKNKLQEKVDNILENEEYISIFQDDRYGQLKQYLIEFGFADIGFDVNQLADHITVKINTLIHSEYKGWNQYELMDKLYYLFIKDISDDISDHEIQRLKHEATRIYYDNFILQSQKKSLRDRINDEFQYFQERSLTDDFQMYFGTSYGEEKRESSSYPQSYSDAYIDLSKKSSSDLVNLAVVKIKMEEDFISFKLNKFIVFMYDHELIDEKDYFLYIFGTTDKQKIEFSKFGLSVNLIGRLERDKQIGNLRFDAYNNLIGNNKFQEFRTSIDDFYNFEISRYLN